MTNSGTEDFCFRIFENSTTLEIDSIFDFLKERSNSQIILQVIDPVHIVSKKQLQSAIYHAEKSFESQRNIARNKANEVVIRIAGKRQISNALKLIGIKESSQYLLVIAFGDTLENNRNELEKFALHFNLNESEIEQTLPISNLEVLSSYYECQEDFEEIEKNALEKIASVEIL